MKGLLLKERNGSVETFLADFNSHESIQEAAKVTPLAKFVQM